MTPTIPDAEVRRGRPRNESCTTEILHATLMLVAEVGIAGLTIDAVATRAGVGKATIYRRWSSKEALLLDAWATFVRPAASPDTGNLRDDLAVVLGSIEDPLNDIDLQRVFPQMIAASKVNPDVADAYREFIAQRRAPLQAVLRRAMDRGEIDPSCDLDLVHDLLVAPLLYRWLVTDAPIDDALIRGIIHVVTTGIAAGR
jgi:AcrR family transcriptional regulator